ncbi:MAG: septum formation initiator family protein [bacterium]|nr:septum formation initiator family protein [bacterium]
MFKRLDAYFGELLTKRINKRRNGEKSFFERNIRKLTACAVVLFSFAMIFKGLMQIPQIRKSEAYIKELNDRIEYEGIRQKEIDELKDKVDTDEYIEKIAGEKLGLVKNNARIFIDVSE